MLFLFLPKGCVGLTSTLELTILVVLHKGQTEWVNKSTNHSDTKVHSMPEE